MNNRGCRQLCVVGNQGERDEVGCGCRGDGGVRSDSYECKVGCGVEGVRIRSYKEGGGGVG